MGSRDTTDRVTDQGDGPADVARQLDRAEFRRLLLSLSPEEFEYFITDVWGRVRPGTPEVTELSGDMGVDVAITDGLEREMIQVKRYGNNNTVGRPEVQQYYSLYDQENADRVTIVTSGTFTAQAKSWADTHGVTLYDYNGLYELFQDAGLSDILSKYFIEADYSLRDPTFPGLKRVLRTVGGLPRLVIRVGRPVWAGVVAASATILLLLNGLGAFIALSMALGLFSGTESGREGSSVALAGSTEAVLLWVLVSSLVLFPVGLADRGYTRRALVFVVLVVGSPFALDWLTDMFPDGGAVPFIAAATVCGVALMLAVTDLRSLYSVGIWTHSKDAFVRYLDYAGFGDETQDTDTVAAVNPLEYATVAEQKRD
ncbi:MAG: hypothetical protein ACI9HI_001342 [Salinirussus sp.]|jgi:hypothetical protein